MFYSHGNAGIKYYNVVYKIQISQSCVSMCFDAPVTGVSLSIIISNYLHQTQQLIT